VFKAENEPGIKLRLQSQRKATGLPMVSNLYSFKYPADCSQQYRVAMMNLHQNTSSRLDVVRVRQKLPCSFLFFSKTMFLDTRPASISLEDGDDDIIPPAKGPKKNNAELSESGDGSSESTLEHNSGDNASSGEDLTVMRRETVQQKLMSEVKCFFY